MDSSDKLPEETEADFPLLAGSGYLRTSDYDPSYNCVSHALGFCDRWTQPPVMPSPFIFWPPGVMVSFALDAYVELFQHYGYTICSDGKPVELVEKIALYGDLYGQFTHVAKQLENGRWTSKLGAMEDIEHPDTIHVESDGYGEARIFMERDRDQNSD